MRDTTIDDIKSLTERCERAESEVAELKHDLERFMAAYSDAEEEIDQLHGLVERLQNTVFRLAAKQ